MPRHPTIGFFLGDGQLGVISLCGIFYPTAYRANGAGWASGVAKNWFGAGPTGGRLGAVHEHAGAEHFRMLGYQALAELEPVLPVSLEGQFGSCEAR